MMVEPPAAQKAAYERAQLPSWRKGKAGKRLSPRDNATDTKTPIRRKSIFIFLRTGPPNRAWISVCTGLSLT